MITGTLCPLCNLDFPDLWDHFWDKHPLFAESVVGTYQRPEEKKP